MIKFGRNKIYRRCIYIHTFACHIQLSNMGKSIKSLEWNYWFSKTKIQPCNQKDSIIALKNTLQYTNFPLFSKWPLSYRYLHKRPWTTSQREKRFMNWRFNCSTCYVRLSLLVGESTEKPTRESVGRNWPKSQNERQLAEFGQKANPVQVQTTYIYIIYT